MIQLKNLSFIFLFNTITITGFAQQNPFSTCWLFSDTTTQQGQFGYPLITDTVGRVFMTLLDVSEEHIILDENGNQIGSSPYPFSAVAKSGNYYRWFSITDSASAETAAVLEKVSPFNVLIWRDTIGYVNNASDYLSVFSATDEYLVVVGWSIDSAQTNDFISKYDPSGNVEWNTPIGNGDYPYWFIVLSTGNYLIEGTANSSPGDDIAVTKITAGGQIIWHTVLNSPYYPLPWGLVEENNGGCYVLSYTIDLDDPYANAFFIVDHLDSNGVVTPGTKSFYNEYIDVRIKDSEGNLLVCSWEDSYWPEGLFLRKIDPDLNILWEQHDWEASDNGTLLTDLQDNYYWLVNDAEPYPNNHGTLYKYNSNGGLEWQLTLSGSNSDSYHPNGLELRNNEQLLLLGKDEQIFQNSIRLESIDLNGTIEWDVMLDTVLDPLTLGMTKLNDDTYYLTGKYFASLVEQGHFCFKLCVNTATGGLSPALNNLLEAHPNPLLQSAIISFSLNKSSQVILGVTDVNGISIITIANETFSAGYHEITFQRESLAPGIYFLEMKTSEGRIMKKMVII